MSDKILTLITGTEKIKFLLFLILIILLLIYLFVFYWFEFDFCSDLLWTQFCYHLYLSIAVWEVDMYLGGWCGVVVADVSCSIFYGIIGLSSSLILSLREPWFLALILESASCCSFFVFYVLLFLFHCWFLSVILLVPVCCISILRFFPGLYILLFTLFNLKISFIIINIRFLKYKYVVLDFYWP